MNRTTEPVPAPARGSSRPALRIGDRTLSYAELAAWARVRGPNPFTEYLNRPYATAEAFTEDGWFRSGDMAVREQDGHVRIVGREPCVTCPSCLATTSARS